MRHRVPGRSGVVRRRPLAIGASIRTVPIGHATAAPARDIEPIQDERLYYALVVFAGLVILTLTAAFTLAWVSARRRKVLSQQSAKVLFDPLEDEEAWPHLESL